VNVDELKFEPDEDDWNAWLQRRSIRTVLDVGANDGGFAAAIREILPDARIYSFEPLPETYEQLVAAHADWPGFEAFNVALGDHDGDAPFYRSEFSDSSSFLRMEELHKEAFPFTSTITKERVTVRRLDDVASTLHLEPAVLLKLDVQGFEDRVIAGGVETLGRTEVVLVETSFRPLYVGQPLFADIHELLHGHGFSYHGSWHQLHDPRDGIPLSQDSIFLRGES
jgi:FkbM family methyltransferase